ncbi:tRNA delta(2)-isopentenylpyrophosphate transferase [Hyphomonas neptunium ATCC 15444]|uniref:tRNA dimethylallyltransferase n=2 Tax=Hyphomonas TaxID=85 RepID=MIAA_HYPNA|nr:MULTISPECIES: tRNA (adenosine(37)-N6)-dimethylallyltransferase MiaA [Hyphomonas]Q0C511.1 RecName: Full=tRNA dimethylallyltransferase; AltName: Full=Dimethylallyl diphosphate:tRNA dimethylallyltransferase; Short=DMAPP:tRNA dimethylallyltransferase; Short=DMATase; AltName: Full=Isopentenyl-diphosphate:tRNA isopentenyltransferase; Short=IPP transferase; Short=IPPT; Short=IPTase [Hyphomonas neptunium ATCC 15444]ABI76679.1 tRNA delta(2)-isopentenylpyrophosphate transferase [Hyphomonas neptunium ATC
MHPAILIHGPTASGKSALAIELARKLGGEVINADSMQVYSDLQVISARPTEEEMAGVPHHLFGYVDAGRRYSTGEWLESARSVLKRLQRQNKHAVIVGGTGLYLLALTQGLSDIPPVPEDIRAEVKAISESEGADGLRLRLAPHDPELAERLGTGDRQRLARAYEVWLATGRQLSEFQNERQPPVLKEGEWVGFALTPPRAALYKKIDRRFEGMLMQGAVAEARALVSRNLDPELPAMKALGMPSIAAFVRGEISAEEAAESAKRESRRYAKRQFTWIGRQFPFWPRIPSPEVSDRMRVIFALYREIDTADTEDYA